MFFDPTKTRLCECRSDCPPTRPSSRTQPGIYYATMASFLIAFVHFFLEYTVYRTTARGALAPLVISSVSFLWMFVGRSYYLAHARAH